MTDTPSRPAPQHEQAARAFPVLNGPHGCPRFVRWSALSETRAMFNHGQSLARLAERGGLDPLEIAANLAGTSWGSIPRPTPETIAAAVETIRPIACDPARAIAAALNASPPKEAT
jgi:hypothetical protein